MNKRGPKPDPDTPYKKWLCYLLASVADEDRELPIQHDDAFEVIGKQIALGKKSVAAYSAEARKQLATETGEQEYIDWCNKRELMWWLHRVICGEKRENVLLEYVGEMDGDTLILTRGEVHITPKEAEPLICEAKERLKRPRGRHDYQLWLAKYKRRSPQLQRSPQVILPVPEGSPAAIDMEERRTAEGLMNKIKPAGRRPRRPN